MRQFWNIACQTTGSSFGKVALVTLAAALTFGCGSASNNDQGVSVTLYQMVPSSSAVPLSVSTEGVVSTGALSGTYGFQNNLSSQGFRLQRIFLRFFVEASDEQPPETTVAIGAVLGPAGTAEVLPGEDVQDGTLPDGFNDLPNSALVSAFVIPPEIKSWLNLNRDLLPEPPYSLTIEAFGIGITTAGDQLETNPLSTSVTITPDVIINPEAGGEEESAADPEVNPLDESATGGDSDL